MGCSGQVESVHADSQGQHGRNPRNQYLLQTLYPDKTTPNHCKKLKKSKYAALYHSGQQENYDSAACFHYLNEAGKMQYGQNFQLQYEDHSIILKLLLYAIKDEDGCREEKLICGKGSVRSSIRIGDTS